MIFSVYSFLSSLLALSLFMKIKLVNEKDDQTQRGETHSDWFLFSVEHLNCSGAGYLLHTSTASVCLISSLILSPG